LPVGQQTSNPNSDLTIYEHCRLEKKSQKVPMHYNFRFVAGKVFSLDVSPETIVGELLFQGTAVSGHPPSLDPIG
jgi:hypothetical protein